MATNLIMPKIGLTMTEGKIVEWQVAEGAEVRAGDILFVFETEKVTFEVAAERAGFLARILAPVDEVVAVGGLVGVLADDPNETVDVPRPGGVLETSGSEVPAGADPAESVEKVRATPLARKLARDLGVRLEDVAKQVGPGKRIGKEDVERAAQAAVPAPSGESPPDLPVGGPEPVPLSGMRRIIGERMLASTQRAAQTYMTVQADAGNLLEMRQAVMPAVRERAGTKPTITDVLMLLVASAIRDHPVLNAQLTDAGIVYHRALHLGMAMALDDGLVVPVIRDIHDMPLAEITRTRADLVARGRAGRLTPDEMKGSTFTLSSLGMFGIDEFCAIINQPESAILAVGAIVERPVVVETQVRVRPTVKMTLTYDHRVIDGAKAAGFLRDLRELVEHPARALV